MEVNIIVCRCQMDTELDKKVQRIMYSHLRLYWILLNQKKSMEFGYSQVIDDFELYLL